MEQRKLTGNLALVTDASRGPGKAIAVELAKEGAHVVRVGRNEQKTAGGGSSYNSLGRPGVLFHR